MTVPTPASLMRAYKRTIYSAGPAILRVGARSETARILLGAHRVRSAVLVTAWNPMSRRMPARWNRRAQRSLLQHLRRSWVIPAEGSWRRWREEHVLVLGTPTSAIRLARQYRQRAVVLLRPDGSARLMLLT